MDYGEKMNWSAALVEWESGGLEDIPTANLEEFLESLEKELAKRYHSDVWKKENEA